MTVGAQENDHDDAHTNQSEQGQYVLCIRTHVCRLVIWNVPRAVSAHSNIYRRFRLRTILTLMIALSKYLLLFVEIWWEDPELKGFF